MANVSFKGSIGKVRDVQFSNDGKPRFGFSVGENHSRLDQQTQQWEQTGTTWWSVTVFGRQAEALAEVIREGAKQRVVVFGRSATREYEQNGEKRTSLDVIADSVGIIPANPQQGGNNGSQGFSSQGGGFGGQQQPSRGQWGGQQQSQGSGWGDEVSPF